MVHLQVVMIFIANNYLMIRHLLFWTFCINPSHEVAIAETNIYQGRIYAKATNGMELTPSYLWYVVMIFIANYKTMSRHLLFLTFA